MSSRGRSDPAGIDGALHVVSRMLGQGVAQKVALTEEYDWRPGAPFARAALADRLIPEVDLDSVGRWTLLSTEGGRDRWEIAFRGHNTRAFSLPPGLPPGLPDSLALAAEPDIVGGAGKGGSP